MVSVGIDCATAAGWARVESGAGQERLLGHGVLDLKDPAKAWGLIARLAALTPAPDVVAIELPYVGKNIDTTIKLALLAGQFLQAFAPTGAVVKLVRASQWQAAVLGKFGGRRREEKKKAALVWARAMFRTVLTIDEADATGLAVWAARFNRPARSEERFIMSDKQLIETAQMGVIS